jgi:hypothetical protein
MLFAAGGRVGVGRLLVIWAVEVGVEVHLALAPVTTPILHDRFSVQALTFFGRNALHMQSPYGSILRAAHGQYLLLTTVISSKVDMS